MKDITKISCFWVLTSWLADLSLSGNRPVVCVCLWLISWRGRWREKNIVFGCLWSLGQSPYDFERDGLAPCKCHQFSKTCHQVFAELCLHDQCQQFDEPSAAGVSYSHGRSRPLGFWLWTLSTQIDRVGLRIGHKNRHWATETFGGAVGVLE